MIATASYFTALWRRGTAVGYGGSLTIANCIVSGNSATYGTSTYFNNGTVSLTNSTISGNWASSSGGGGLRAYRSAVTLTNVTISGNSGTQTSGILVDDASTVLLRNSIVWGNAVGQIQKTADGSLTATNSIVQGGYTGATDADPLFVTPVPSAPTTSGNLRLRAASPAIDAGDDGVTSPSLPSTDLDGNPRIIGSAVDLGAYEALPAVASISRAGAPATTAASVEYVVTFSVPVSGVMAHDFALTTSGSVAGSTVTGVMPSDSAPARIWTATVGTGSGDGTIRLDLNDDDGITTVVPPSSSTPLGGAGAGNGSFTSGESYTIDRTAPDTSITLGPTNPTRSASATFEFGGSDGQGSGIASFECKLDDGDWTTCTSPMAYSGLIDGEHAFQVRAADAAGNYDATPAGHAWTVDTTIYRIFVPWVDRS